MSRSHFKISPAALSTILCLCSSIALLSSDLRDGAVKSNVQWKLLWGQEKNPLESRLETGWHLPSQPQKNLTLFCNQCQVGRGDSDNPQGWSGGTWAGGLCPSPAGFPFNQKWKLGVFFLHTKVKSAPDQCTLSPYVCLPTDKTFQANASTVQLALFAGLLQPHAENKGVVYSRKLFPRMLQEARRALETGADRSLAGRKDKPGPNEAEVPEL